MPNRWQARLLLGVMRGAGTSDSDESLEAKVARVHHWRERMLDVALRASFAAHLIGSLVHVALTMDPKFRLVGVALGVGVLHHWSRSYAQRFGLRSVVFLGSLFAESVFLAAYLAWSPAVVMIALFTTVYGGLLLGRIGAFAVPLSYLLALLAGGACVRAGWTFSFQSHLDEPRNWLRNAAFFFGVTGVMALSLRHVLDSLVSLRAVARDALNRVARETESVEVTRSSRVATELVVQQAQQLQTVAQLSGGVAHLVKNTLTVVRAAIEQLGTAKSAAAIHEALEGVVSTVERSAATMRALLVFSRREQPKLESVALAQQIRGLRNTLEEALPKNISYREQLTDTSPVAAEALRVHQLILNLVLNARDAISGEGEITLSTQSVSITSAPSGQLFGVLSAGPYVAMTVRDNGSGMGEQVVARACEPFFSTRDPSQHEGLGLFVVFGLLKQWGGALSIQSHVGSGTTVTTYFPEQRVSVDAKAAEAPSPEATDNTESRQLDAVLRDRTRACPTPDRSPVEEWKEAGLQHTLLLLALASGLAILTNYLLGRITELLGIASLATGCAIVLTTWRLRALSTQLRLGVAVAALSSVTTLLLLRNGYMSVGAVAGHATAVLLTAVYADRRTTWGVLWLMSLLFLCGARGPAVGVWHDGNVDPNMARNWFRVAIVLPLVMLITSTMVLDVLSAAAKSLEQIDLSLARLLHTRHERACEDQSLIAARRIAQRAPRIEAIGRLSGAIAHDLNNALGGILGWAMLLYEDPEPSTNDVKDAIAAFSESVELAEALVAQLQPHTTHHRANASVDGADTTDVALQIGKMGLVLQRVLRDHVRVKTEAESHCYVAITENSLRRILLNLATNARDAMPHGGVFALSCCRDAKTKRIVLVVEDSGLGMSEETQTHIFDAFFTTKSPSEGTGLGLHTVAQLVESSGGRIELSSALGKGTRFVLSWPEALAPALKRPSAVPIWIESRGAILLAEDNDWVRRAMVRGLARAGYEVVAAVDGTDARNRLDERGDWIALCTDAVMPGYSSLRLIEDFQERFPRRPILVCSGQLPGELGHVASRDTFRLLAKPFSPASLTAALQEELERWEAFRESAS